MKLAYEDFLKTKAVVDIPTGLSGEVEITPKLFDFQKDIVKWALKRGRSAIFADCGLGKTPMQLEWARHVPGNVLILAPLAVAHQTVREGLKFGIEVNYCRHQNKVKDGITITNYEILDSFDAESFTGVVLDESSILKNYMGRIKRQVLESFKDTPFKLACTATPSPNDHMELGNHADFLNIMPSNEMLSRFFINDTMQAGNYRLKKHAEKHFWAWVASWAVCLSLPSDVGGNDEGYILPKLNIYEHRVEIDHNPAESGSLFPDAVQSATMLYSNLRQSLKQRSLKAYELVRETDDGFIIWCHTDEEADILKELIPEAVEVRGSEPQEKKESKLRDFTEGKYKSIITKPKLGGWGLNWQHIHNVIFVSMDYSYEMLYQAMRRSYRFGQASDVNVHIITSNLDVKVLETVKQKEEAHRHMQANMVEAMRQTQIENVHERLRLTDKPEYKKETGKGWELVNGDSGEVLSEIESGSIDFSIYSPPFVGLYIYSDSFRDLGNCKDDEEFYTQYRYIVSEMYRITRPGRLSAVHCKNLVKYQNRDGAAGIKDFRGDIIRLHQAEGWELHSEVVIWKDPVIEMQRTKAHGLLHKQVCKDASFSRQGIPEYLLIFRKWDGEPEQIKSVEHLGGFDFYIGNESPTIKDNKRLYSIHVWQRYASPVWFDIQQTNVLNNRIVRDDRDEKHICPLQLDVIRRSIHLWTNPGDLVLSPFAGIGSEGFVALEMDRKFIGIELKEAYWKQAKSNLEQAAQTANGLFASSSPGCANADNLESQADRRR